MINLISKDLRKEEVYVQIADCLECLQNITAESFDKINANLESLNNDLIKIERRREVVKNKIEQIKKNNNKAIQIHSPFYYPAKEIKDQYKYQSLVRSIQPKKPNIQESKYSISQPFELFHPDDLNEMLNFSDLDTFLKTERESLNFLQRQKLNKSTVPWNRIKSISSLIIFNSSETAYIKTDQDSSIHEFKVANKQKKNEEDNELNFGNIAPPSMTKKDKFEMSFEQNLFRIDTQEAPKVLDNLPNDLPDLGAVADDIFFNEDTSIKFASSNFSPAEPEEKATESKQLPSKLFRIFSFDQSSTSSIEELKVPDATKASKHETAKKSDNERPKTDSIPPPPPLPADSSSFESSTELEKKPVEKRPAIAMDNSRASLLDAIRKAAGRPDKSKTTIKEKKLEERKNRKEAVSTDLMSDLKKHLKSRREAMVGVKLDRQENKKETKPSGDVYKSMTNKITTMIPSPTSSAPSSEQSDIEDWVN